MTSLLASKHSKSSHCKKGVYDYIIIGNGTAGAVLAAELSKDKKHSVLVLETGPNLSDDPEVLDPNIFDYALDLTLNPKYALTYPILLSNGFLQTLTYSEGRMWGGSSAHNYLLTVHGTPDLYNSWAQASGSSRWAFSNLLPVIRNVETYTPNGTSANLLERGNHGPIYVTQNPPVDTNPLAIGISNATGAPLVSDYNDPTEGNTGVSAYQQFITPPPFSHRSFSINGYLPESVVTPEGRGRHGRKLRIVSHANVSRILFDGNKAIGIECVVSGNNEEVHRAYAKKKVILCAGGINSPAILQRSGIGDATLLTSLDIPVIVDNPNVGANLSNQPGCIVFLGGTSSDNVFSMINASPYYPNDDVRRIQYLTNPGEGAILSYGFVMDPQSRGSVEIVNKDPFTYPLVDLNMYSDGPVTQPGTDLYTIVSFLKIVQDIAADAGMTVLSPTPSDYGLGDAGLAQFAQSNPNIIITDHISGTCRMATTAEDGVVDGNLHVFGTEHLMVVDLSVAPQQPDGNPCFPVYVIANEAAKIILGN